MLINESEIVKRYRSGDSPYKIAADLNTNPTKIRRILEKLGEKTRSKSEAQKLALKNGTATHPTKGRARTDEEKSKISKSAVAFWDNATQDKKDWRSETSRKIWQSIPKDKLEDMRDKAIKAIQLAAKTGSKLEKEVCNILTSLGYVYETHRTVFMISTKNLEVDIYIPSIQTIIEIDGLSHFEPIWGEEALQKQISFDTQKEGLIKSKGFNLIRIENKCSSFAIKRIGDLKNNLKTTLEQLTNLKGEYRVIKYG
jgi:very-short-patch-repair endonuclease/DNA-binding CsgD family transcriptional regulator